MLEKVAYVLLGIATLAWVCMMIAGMVMMLPEGIFGLITIVGVGLLLIKVIRERLENKEDDHYSKNVHL